MGKTEFKKIFRWVRKIRGSQMVGTHGHLSDIRDEYGVSMAFLHKVYGMNNKRNRLVYGKYTTEWQDAQNQADAWDSYYERMAGA